MRNNSKLRQSARFKSVLTEVISTLSARRLMYVLIGIQISFYLPAQIQSDTIQAHNHLALGDTLLKELKFEQSIAHFEEALAGFSQAKVWQRAIYVARQVSRAHWEQAHWDQALEAGLNALELYNQNPTVPDQKVKCLNNLGYVLTEKGELPEAEKYLKEAISILQNLYGEDHPKLAASYERMGGVYNDLGRMQEALEILNKLLKIDKASLPPGHLYLGYDYLNIGTAYLRTREYHKALTYFQQSLEIFRQNSGEIHPNTAASYYNMANTHVNLRHGRTALEFHFKALDIYLEIFEENNPRIIRSYSQIGATYNLLGKLDSAAYYINKSLIINEKRNNERVLVYDYFKMGLVEVARNNLEKAKDYLEKSVNLFSKHFGKNSPQTTQAYNALARVSLLENQPTKALSLLEQAEEANLIGGDIKNLEYPFENYFDRSFLLATLTLKAQAGFLVHKNDRESDGLQVLTDNFKRANELIRYVRKSYHFLDDKTAFSSLVAQNYQLAIDIFYQLHLENPEDKSIQENIFSVIENGKASSLADQLTNTYIKQYTGVPESIMELERALRQDLAYHRSRTNINEVIKISRALDSLESSYEENYPLYHSLKYENESLSIQELQNQLSDKEALLEYFEGDSNLYVLVILNSTVEFMSIVEGSDSMELVQDRVLSFRQTFNPSGDVSSLSKVSRELYSDLLAKPLATIDSDVTSLIIIPSPALSVFPWEVLQKEGEGNLGRNQYILNEFAVSYANSATLLKKRKSGTNNRAPEKGLLAFAPSYNESPEYSNIRAIFRSELIPLKWNVPEVASINKFFEGEVLTGGEATESNFKQQAPNYQVLHLAMHALVDHEESMNSKLVFTQDNDSIEDGMLHTFELFNMDLPAEMVVLSACNTGVGEIQEGEGVMSLARAFAYAGVPSMVMSHWNVNDESTSKLMASFYKHLADGLRKDEALRQAKLGFLAQANEIQAHPFYWGGFVVVGDASPLDHGKNWNWVIISLVTLSLGLLLWITLRRKDKESLKSKVTM